MTSLNISLPEQLKSYIESQVEAGDYGTPSEYVRDLIRQDKERRLAALEKTLLDALGSEGFTLDMDAIEPSSFVSVIREKLAARKK